MKAGRHMGQTPVTIMAGLHRMRVKAQHGMGQTDTAVMAHTRLPRVKAQHHDGRTDTAVMADQSLQQVMIQRHQGRTDTAFMAGQRLPHGKVRHTSAGKATVKTFSVLTAALALLLAVSLPAQARLVKEMQVTRSGKAAAVQEGGLTVYKLLLEGNKLIVIGDREFFPPATRAALDQAVERKLTVEIVGHLLIHNDQSPMFALPLGKLEIKGLDAKAQPPGQPSGPQTGQPSGQDAGAEAFKEAKLKGNTVMNLGQALEAYAFFTQRSWKVLDPSKAEFRGEIDLNSITELDSRYVERLRSKDLNDTFKSLTFVAVITIQGGMANCPDPAMEAVFQDGTKDRLVWKDPPGYYWDRIYRNKKISFDYFLSKAALNPKFGKGMSPAAQQ